MIANWMLYSMALGAAVGTCDFAVARLSGYPERATTENMPSSMVAGALVELRAISVKGRQQQQAGSDTTVRNIRELDRNPELINGSQMPGFMERLYPRELQDLGLGGTVMMEFIINQDGVADSTSIRAVQTQWANLGEASVYAVKRMRFSPGVYRGQPARVFIQMPITWRPRDQ